MQEYLFVKLEKAQAGSKETPRYVNGREIENWRDLSLQDYLQVLRSHGWRLVDNQTLYRSEIVLVRSVPSIKA